MDFNVSLKAKECLANVLKVNPEMFEEVKQDILWNIDEEFLEFFNSIDYNKDVYYYLKHNDYFSKKFSYTSVGDGIYNILKNNQTIGNMILDYCLDKENDVLTYKRYINYKYTYNNEIENEKIIKEYYNLVTNQDIKNYLDFIKTLNTLETIEEINSYLQQSNMEPNGEFYNKHLFDLSKKDLHDSCFRTDKYKEVDGIKIIDNSVCDLSKFNIMAHVINDRKQSYSPNGELSLDLQKNPELWSNNNYENASDLLSCSLVSENALSFFGDVSQPNVVILGFNNLKDVSIRTVSSCDAVTKMEGSKKDFSNEWVSVANYDCPPSQINSDLSQKVAKKVGYNEIAFGRKLNGENIKPDYIISTTNFSNNKKNCPINDNMKAWAKYYDIPIVEIDGNVIYEKAKEELDQYMHILKSNQLSLELFDNIVKRMRIIENIKDIPLNVYSVLDNFFKIVKNNPTYENINALIMISQKYNIEALYKFLENDFDKSKDLELYRQRVEELKQNLEMLNKQNLELHSNEMKIEEPNSSMVRGFVAIYSLVTVIISYIMFLFLFFVYKFILR